MKELAVLVVALTVIAGVAGFGLALVFSVTEEPMRAAEEAFRLESITAVLPPFVNSPSEDSEWVESGDYSFFLAKDESGNLVGLAFTVSSKEGYGGTVTTMLGVTPEGEIIRIKNIAHRETPGLGSKIKEDKFKGQFYGANLENRTFEVRKDNPGTPEKPPIDAITGATISSRAVATPVRDGLLYYVEHKGEIIGNIENNDEEGEQQ